MNGIRDSGSQMLHSLWSEANANSMMRAGISYSGSDVHIWLRFTLGFGDFVP